MLPLQLSGFLLILHIVLVDSVVPSDYTTYLENLEKKVQGIENGKGEIIHLINGDLQSTLTRIFEESSAAANRIFRNLLRDCQKASAEISNQTGTLQRCEFLSERVTEGEQKLRNLYQELIDNDIEDCVNKIQQDLFKLQDRISNTLTEVNNHSVTSREALREITTFLASASSSSHENSQVPLLENLIKSVESKMEELRFDTLPSIKDDLKRLKNSPSKVDLCYSPAVKARWTNLTETIIQNLRDHQQ